MTGNILAREGSLLLVGYNCIQKLMYIRPTYEFPLVRRMYRYQNLYFSHNEIVLHVHQYHELRSRQIR